MRFIDIVGMKYNKLTVISFDGRRGKQSFWVCKCDCGNETIVNGAKLKNGHTKSCGCFLIERRGKSSRTHGKSHTPEHNVWLTMTQRCYNKNNPSYPDYGGRGIVMCDRWLGDKGFSNFLIDMGSRPSKNHTIERMDNNKIYSPDNCFWDTRYNQNRNKRSNHWLTVNGRKRLLVDWGNDIGVKGYTIYRRIKRGWPLELAVSLPSENKPLHERIKY